MEDYLQEKARIRVEVEPYWSKFRYRLNFSLSGGSHQYLKWKDKWEDNWGDTDDITEMVPFICEIFQISKLENLNDKECIVLRCFNEWSEDIEGFKIGNKKFTLTAFKRKTNPTYSVLDETSKKLLNNISRLQYDLEHAKEEYETLVGRFKDWEKSENK